MFDIIIKSGRIVDGTGNPWFNGDIGLLDDRIAAIGKLNEENGKLIINANNKIVCPGFIDMHSHSDVMLLANPRHEPKIMQGVTTEVLGLDGLSYAPLSFSNLQDMRCYLSGLNGNPNISWTWSSVSEYLALFDYNVAVNVVYLVPHNVLRLEVIGFINRSATAEELKKMQKVLARGIQQGAVGFSTGLDYCPARYSNKKELINICETVTEYDGLSVWHTRMRDLGLIQSINEVIDIANVTKGKMHFSHYGANGVKNWGKSKEMLAIIDRARANGLDVSFDSYPYTATSSTMIACLPLWVHEGGSDAILDRLKNRSIRKKIHKDIETEGRPWDRCVITGVSTAKNKFYVGKSFVDASIKADKEIPVFICDLLLEEELNASFACFVGNEEDIQIIMRHPCHTVGSDGLLIGDRPLPRGWGTFARYLGIYSRELGILSLEQVIRHMTSASANRLGLTDRGLIKKGLAGDIVIFNSKTIIDKATFDEPKEYPTGIEYVLVNGGIVVDKGKHTGLLNGRSLIRN